MEKHVDPMRTESCLLSGGWSPPSVDAIFIWRSHHKRSERNLHNLQGKLLIALWKGKKKENSNLAILKEREERHFQNLLFTSLDTKGKANIFQFRLNVCTQVALHRFWKKEADLFEYMKSWQPKKTHLQKPNSGRGILHK